MKGWSERTWRTKEGAEIHVESDTADACRKIFRTRVKHLHQWVEATREMEEVEE